MWLFSLQWNYCDNRIDKIDISGSHLDRFRPFAIECILAFRQIHIQQKLRTEICISNNVSEFNFLFRNLLRHNQYPTQSRNLNPFIIIIGKKQKT